MVSYHYSENICRYLKINSDRIKSSREQNLIVFASKPPAYRSFANLTISFESPKHPRGIFV